MNAYQLRKARVIVALLCAAQAESNVSRSELRKVVAHMSPEQWRTVCLTAGVAVADLPAKQAVLEALR